MISPLNVLDLFSGIGGFSHGLERTGGFRTVAFCEQNAYAAAVLKRHWPDVPCFGDVRDITADSLAFDGVPQPDVVCGGFPCQDISLAGKGAGLGGDRSGLWFEMLRIIAETQPRYVVAENVSALRSRGLGVVLGGLASIGYDAEWHCIPAAAVGAPHRRDRVWILAYTGCVAERLQCRPGEMGGAPGGGGRAAREQRTRDAAGDGGEIVADAACEFEQRGRWNTESPGVYQPANGGEVVADAVGTGCTQSIGPSRPILGARPGEHAGLFRGVGNTWLTEPDVGRVADGVPSRVDRLRCLGNAVVPQIPEIIGAAILSHVCGVYGESTT